MDVMLDKNELPWGQDKRVKEAIIARLASMDFNRYPDNDCTELKKALSGYTGLDTGMICIGNGSDELILLAIQAFVEPGETIAVHMPTFMMYKSFGGICGARVWEYETGEGFELELDDFITCLQKEKPRLTFLCSPNNPTGGRFELQELEQLLDKAPGMVVIDEAYFEFSGITVAGLIHKYEKLIVLRTFSKALGLAGLRIGYMLAAPSVISCVERIRSPYNVSSFSQAAAVEVLKNLDVVKERIELVKAERSRLYGLLSKLEGIKCFESWGNFILIRSPYAGEIFKSLQESGIHIRKFSDPRLEGCLRLTVGSPGENDRLIKAVKEVLYGRG